MKRKIEREDAAVATECVTELWNTLWTIDYAIQSPEDMQHGVDECIRQVRQLAEVLAIDL